jgi:GNAT superfamily N-acetyltransferase
MADWRIERLQPVHQRQDFCCGKIALDEFLRTRVSQYEKRRLGRTWVAVCPPDNRVYGYYTLASSAVAFENLPKNLAKKLPKHPLPVLLLARLAVDQTAKGQCLGKLLLHNVFQKAIELSANMGIHAVEVDALDEEARQFYGKFGFSPFLDNEKHLFLPMATIEDALKASIT